MKRCQWMGEHLFMQAIGMIIDHVEESGSRSENSTMNC
ncbi:MAG TPA: DNA-3-methyladenine glycosylase I [Candidatus Salinicoccus stercoripullorum]|uniref:DNA-3-methyladenine glycosylase I n=1 Tax=Candidatus Salinicoccus stercoripullorum TaxID=2838756 RepID=A0A9D1QH69_9STAP|nr:DNA-3-methyladenine glycosylase I [Candidatus Salinicoccus stercoripullorum]